MDWPFITGATLRVLLLVCVRTRACVYSKGFDFFFFEWRRILVYSIPMGVFPRAKTQINSVPHETKITTENMQIYKDCCNQ